MVGSIVVDGVLTHYVLPHFVYDLKTAQINAQHGLIPELMFYECKLGYKAREATKNICRAEGEGTVDQNTVNRWFEKFYSRKILLTLKEPRWSGKVS